MDDAVVVDFPDGKFESVEEFVVIPNGEIALRGRQKNGIIGLPEGRLR